MEIRQWLTRKALTVQDLADFGARWCNINGTHTLVYMYIGGEKYRTVDEPAIRWNQTGRKYDHPKMIRREPRSQAVIVAEGETDAMQLARAYPKHDICCLPLGAQTISKQTLKELEPYERVLVGLDDDTAGDLGAKIILDAYPRTAVRMRPPHGDWCDTAVANGPLHHDPMEYVTEGKVPAYTVREVLMADLGTHEDNNYFEDGILPVGGSLIFHGAMKSLKSVIQMDMLRALATGTPFAGRDGYRHTYPGGPVKVALIQMEIRPQPFQERVMSFLELVDADHREQFLDNLYVYGLVNGELPRLKIQQDSFKGDVLRFIDQTHAKVIAFDPLQRLTGSADIDKVNELDYLLDFFAELQNDGITVISSHHNNKSSGPGASHPNAMAGSQRFGADVDAVCSIIHDPKIMLPDDNQDRVRQRNFSWTLRNGSAATRGITVQPHVMNPALMDIQFHPPFAKLDTEPAKQHDGPSI